MVGRRQGVIVAVYLFIFGLATAYLGMDELDMAEREAIADTACAEFQIPPQVARYASFMFSFIGRGVCESKEQHAQGAY